MPMLTEERLTRWARLRKAAAVPGETLEEAMEKSASAADDAEFDVFLSHASKDRENGYLDGLISTLEGDGLVVYVDRFVDDDMHSGRADRRTADRLKNRLRHSKALLYATSIRAVASGWMKWELGLADGLGKKVAVVPVARGTSVADTVKKQEFVGLYPEVIEADGDEGQGMFSRRMLPPKLVVPVRNMGQMPLGSWVRRQGPRLMLPTSRRILREVLGR